MTDKKPTFLPDLLLALACAACLAVLVVWLWREPPAALVQQRRPVVRAAPKTDRVEDRANPGTLTSAPPRPQAPPRLTGDWPQFRGPDRDNIAKEGTAPTADWGKSGPPVLWRRTVGEGHAGVAVHDSRVYLVDYDRDKQEDAIRCLALADGSEWWRYSYSVVVKRNHGMSRTVPAVGDGAVLALGPKCHVTCLDAQTGELLWRKDLTREYDTEVPLWYAGQCPLIDQGRAILAPGAKPLMLALDLRSGQEVWRTQSHEGAGMTHSSIMAMELAGLRQYVYCAGDGVYGVAADDGRVLWHYPDWKIKIANIPSALFVPPDRVFLCGGYGEGAEMIRIERAGDAFSANSLYRLKPSVFGSDQQTPVLYQGHIYGVEPLHGEIACLTPEGKRLWTSGPAARFGLGPYLIAHGRILALDDMSGTLVMAQAAPEGYREEARAKLLEGHDAWAPMAWADGRLILRDLTEMICLDLREAKP